MNFIIPLLIFSFSAFARNNSDLRTYRLIGPNSQTMQAVANRFEVTRRIDDDFEVIVPNSQASAFLQSAPDAQVVNNGKVVEANQSAGYRRFSQVEQELKNLAAQYPHIAKLETFGQTGGGHKMYALKISDNVQVDEAEPELMITSATHGDEIITVEVEMDLINTLLQNYQKDARLTAMIDGKELYFIPMVNPQGYEKRDRYTQGKDPNRDYPSPLDPTKRSVDCIDLLIKWFHSRDIKGSIDLHASGKLIMYPWAYTDESPAPADEAIFETLGNYMAEVNHYRVGQISKIIYVAKGSSADYYYWKNRTLALGIELTSSKAPPFSQVSRVIEESREMLYRFIENF